MRLIKKIIFKNTLPNKIFSLVRKKCTCACPTFAQTILSVLAMMTTHSSYGKAKKKQLKCLLPGKIHINSEVNVNDMKGSKLKSVLEL